MRKLLLLFVMTTIYGIAAAQPKRAAEAPQADNNGTASAQEVCNATMNFLNELVQHGYSNYMDDLYSETKDLMTIRKYRSKTNFPVAKRVLIEDTNTHCSSTAKQRY